VKVAAQPKPIALPLPGGRTDATVRVHPISVAEIMVGPRFFDRPGGPLWKPRGMGMFTSRSQWLWLPIPAFLVEHPGAGPFLIDTGMHVSVSDHPRHTLGRVGALGYKLRMEPEWALPAQLHDRGVDPDDVSTVVMTHLHADHASGTVDFPGATFVVTAREWETAPKLGMTHGYHRNHIDQPFDWRLVDYEAPSVAACGTFSRTVDLFGDGSVRLVSTPGHTYGHQSVLLRLTEGELLVAADAAYSIRTIEETLVPVFHEDEELYRRSLAEIQEFVAQTPDAVVIPGHDPETWPRLEPLYQ
jgi:glyoxylase-like metal-dependent hydrolase (beta-lactamase superfamily II)